MIDLFRRVFGQALRNDTQSCHLLRSQIRWWGGWLQLVALFTLILQPLRTVHAIYVPDAAGNPAWLALDSNDQAPQEGPNFAADANGVPQWMSGYQWAIDSGLIAWWGGNTYLVDGSWVTFPAQYHLAAYGDRDSDGIPDDLDPYPDDASNNSFWWGGGTFTCDNNSRYFDGGYYCGTWIDSDNDSIPDVADPYPFDSVNGNSANPSFWWGGGTFTIDNGSVYFPAGDLSGTWSDWDADGIPDAVDPYPYDANNGNTTTVEFHWDGGSYYVDGSLTSFSGGYFGGVFSDSDGDGVPDTLDPYPGDATNNSSWFGGGTFLIDGSAVTLAGQYHRANVGDSDVDGIPDDLDPYPTDQTNNTFWWEGGTFEVNAIAVTFLAQFYAGKSTDSDGDGIPDVLDTYAQDRTNNTSWWDGGTFLINGEWSSFPAQYYLGKILDTDGDGIPDVLDPYPNDPWNNTYFIWGGGSYWVDGQQINISGGRYGGIWSDRDNDGIPDVVDPYPDDGANNTAWWSGGTFMIDGSWTSYMGENHRADAADADQDGIPDDLDPRPNDGSNNSFYWAGGSYTVDNAAMFFAAQYYPGDGRDTDGDGIPDVLDKYPIDTSNGNDTTSNSFWWGGGSFIINNVSTYFDGRYYTGEWADSDGDGIPDAADPYPFDASNNSSSSFYWGGGYFTINNAQSYFEPNWYSGVWQDSDGDGIPDVVDPYSADANNGNSGNWWPGGSYIVDGVATQIQGQYYNVWVDTDGDGIPDFCDPYVNDANNNSAWWPGGNFLIVGNSVAIPAQYHRANAGDSDADGIPDDLDPYVNDPYNGNYYSWPSQAISLKIDNHDVVFSPTLYAIPWVDSDGDGIPDAADPYADDATNNNDTDNDGIPDRVELSFGLNPTDPADARIVRQDGLTNLQAYQAGLALDAPPMSATLDSDGDGMTDVYEISNGLDRFARADAAGAPLGDFVFNVEKARGGVPANTYVGDAALYEQLTGYAPGGIQQDNSKSSGENDWDGDGISNIDELVVFHSNPRDPSSAPTWQQIRQALFEGKCSLTTRANFFWILNPSGIGGDQAGGGSPSGGGAPGGGSSPGGGPGGSGNPTDGGNDNPDGDNPNGNGNNDMDEDTNGTRKTPFRLSYSDWMSRSYYVPPFDTEKQAYGYYKQVQVEVKGTKGFLQHHHYEMDYEAWPPKAPKVVDDDPEETDPDSLPPNEDQPPYKVITTDYLLQLEIDGTFASAYSEKTTRESDGSGTPSTERDETYYSIEEYNAARYDPDPTFYQIETDSWTTSWKVPPIVETRPVWVDESPGWHNESFHYADPHLLPWLGEDAAEAWSDFTTDDRNNPVGGSVDGKVQIDWDTRDWVGTLSDDAKASWLNRYFILIRETTTAIADADDDEPPVPQITYYTYRLADCIGQQIALSTPTTTGYSISKELLIVPVDVEFVNRDDPTKKWSDSEDGAGMKIYSGARGGDMIKWKVGTVNGELDWNSISIEWFAQGPQGQSVPGPGGSPEWMISNESDDSVNQWLTWDPGKWKLYMTVGGAQTYIEQQIGWRTDDYVVIGQIIPTNSLNGSKPQGTDAWQFRRAMAYDMRPFFISDVQCEAAAALPVPPELYTHIWGAYWGLLHSHGDTPQGPFSSSSTYYPIVGSVSVGTVTAQQRYWMVQTELNNAPDMPKVNEQYRSSELDDLEKQKEYRIMQRDQVKFVLKDGKIDKKSIKRVGKYFCEQGVTKAGFSLAADELYPGSPPFGPITVPFATGETGKQWHQHKGSNDSQVSTYGLARIGSEGQNVNWRLFGRDVPWIYTEIISELGSTGAVKGKHRTSVDMVWDEDNGVTDGQTPFNNLNIYRAETDTEDHTVYYKQQDVLEMEGHVPDFVDSVPIGQYPAPEIPPSVR